MGMAFASFMIPRIPFFKGFQYKVLECRIHNGYLSSLIQEEEAKRQVQRKFVKRVQTAGILLTRMTKNILCDTVPF